VIGILIAMVFSIMSMKKVIRVVNTMVAMVIDTMVLLLPIMIIRTAQPDRTRTPRS
jgi:hypothetical protein